MAIFRVTVRGWFDHLTAEQRAALRVQLRADGDDAATVVGEQALTLARKRVEARVPTTGTYG